MPALEHMLVVTLIVATSIVSASPIDLLHKSPSSPIGPPISTSTRFLRDSSAGGAVDSANLTRRDCKPQSVTYGPNNCDSVYQWFENNCGNPGYTLDGPSNSGAEGWSIYPGGSIAYGSMQFNTPQNPHTQISVKMRGPNVNGKDAYALIIEPRCAFQDQSNCRGDELDIAEMHGPSYNGGQAQATLFKGGVQVGQFNPVPSGDYSAMHVYEFYMERGSALTFRVDVGNWLGTKTDNIPTNMMQFYAGMWDCSNAGGGWCLNGAVDGPNNVPMVIAEIYFSNCPVQV
ncbi:hypothetical protein DFJ73DRAFT_925415 [Zopfochytrium polystomum]|nr:hypothetical protein DFJ73DRAFT_925415 [Zopfochytrium polystomum]